MQLLAEWAFSFASLGGSRHGRVEQSRKQASAGESRGRRCPRSRSRAPIPSDDKRSRKQLIDEIAELRRQLNAKDALDPLRKAHESELKGTKQRVQYLLAVSPAIIYTTKASGDFTCTFVSENLRAIMGYSPEEMTTDPKCWPGHLHPEDAPQSVRGDAAPDRARRGNGRVPLPASQRTLHLDPGHIQGRQRRSRPSFGVGRRLGRYHRAQVHRDRAERARGSACNICSPSVRPSSTPPRPPAISPAPSSARISARSWAIRRRR